MKKIAFCILPLAISFFACDTAEDLTDVEISTTLVKTIKLPPSCRIAHTSSHSGDTGIKNTQHSKSHRPPIYQHVCSIQQQQQNKMEPANQNKNVVFYGSGKPATTKVT